MSHTSNRTLSIQAGLAVAVVWLLLLPCAAGAETDQSAFSVTVPGIESVYVGSGTLIFAPDVIQVLEGWTTPQTLDTTVSANEDWALTITGSQGTWTGPWAKPVGDIYWKYGAGDYAALTTSSANVTTGGPVDNGTCQIDFKIALDLVTDMPGNYSYSYIVIDISAP